MNAQAIQVMLIEDEPAHARLVQRYLSASAEPRFTVTSADTLKAGLDRLKAGGLDIVLLDLGLPDSAPTETLNRVLAAANDTPIVVLTTSDDPEQALEAVKAGAQDHLPKPKVGPDLLVRSIRYAIERKRSEQQLKLFNETLERRVAERSTVAQQRAERLQRLAAELSQAERRERQRMAHLLHDDLQQIIAAARMRLDLAAGETADNRYRNLVLEAIKLLNDAINATRSLTLDLTPPVLSERGLGAALEWLGRRMKDLHDLNVTVTINGDPQKLSGDTASLLLDAARELLFNIFKHAQVQQAVVTLRCDDPGHASLTIEDHGVGCDLKVLQQQEEKDQRFGLFSIRERLEAIGGRFETQSAAGRGMKCTLQAPFATPDLAPAANG